VSVTGSTRATGAGGTERDMAIAPVNGEARSAASRSGLQDFIGCNPLNRND
jgi:hypothetical protein